MASPDVIRRLREIDESAELVYFGAGRWVLGSWRWHSALVAKAENILRRTLEAIERELSLKRAAGMKPRLSNRLLGRVEFALLAIQGFRPIAEYRDKPGRAVLEGYIVEDFRRMDWMYRHLSDSRVDELLNEEPERARSQAHADLTDPHRAADAWRYAFTTSHSVTRHDNPERQRARSGFTIHKVLS